MELIMQPTTSTCGQACIAMIAGKSVEEVIKDMKTDGPHEVSVNSLKYWIYNGVSHAEKNKRISRKILFPIRILF